MSLASSASGIQFIPIALGDEFDNIVLFAQTMDMAEATAVQIGETFFSQTNIQTYAPFTLVLNPSALSLDGKIHRIEYYFGEGKTKFQSFYYSSTSIDSLSLPYSSEPGDPRNFLQENTYFLEEAENKLLSVEVRVYEFGSLDYKRYFVNLDLKPPILDGQSSEYFRNLHLVSTKMFGPENKIFYVFESSSPTYILPALIKWEPLSNITQTINIQSSEIRPYKLLQPFEKENVTPVNTITPISFVVPVSSDNDVIDIGNLGL
jgi:hypothetical protein